MYYIKGFTHIIIGIFFCVYWKRIFKNKTGSLISFAFILLPKWSNWDKFVNMRTKEHENKENCFKNV